MAKESEPQEGQEKQKKPGRGFAATTVYAAFGFLTALVSFVFLVNPAWRPDPRERQIAELTTAAVDVGITYGGWAERVRLPAGDAETACVPGNVVYLNVSVQGFKNRETTLKAFTMNALTHRRVRSIDLSRFTGTAVNDQGVSPLWVEWPYRRAGAGGYFARLELFGGDDLLAITDTPRFRVSASRYNELYYQCINDVRDGKPYELPGFSEASFGGGGGFDVGRWLLYAALAVTAGLIAALAFHGATSVLRRRRQE